MSYYHIEDSCICGSTFKYDDDKGVYSNVDGLKYLGQEEYRFWVETHKLCRKMFEKPDDPQ